MQPNKTGALTLAGIFYLTLFFFKTGFAQQQLQQDTLQLDIPKAEAIFLTNNLALLAAQYDVDINKALVQQAKVWDNPILNTDQNIYDGKFFRHKTENGIVYGQVFVQLQQLILTAGKRDKLVQLAKDNVQSAEARFNEMMRNLKYVLSTDMNNLAQLQATAALYNSQLQAMQTLAKGMDEMLRLGDVSLKDNVRIKALLFSLQNEYADNLRQQQELQKELRTLLLLQNNTWIQADAAAAIPRATIEQISITALLDSAAARPDLALAQQQQLYQQHNLAYQKALAKPDVTLALEYDRNSNYITNYYGLGVSLPLPVFNRNKGNITAASLAVKQAGLAVQQTQAQVNNEVYTAFAKLINTTQLLDEEHTDLQNNYDKLMQNITESYRRRQVSLVEFVDFFESWRDTRNRQLQQVAAQRNAAAELNYCTGRSVILF
jgi:outer membrane protein, heavy metal efflux system